MRSYKPGDHLQICDRCGFVMYASESKKTWDGLVVCKADFEVRHPQDLIRSRADKQTVNDPRPYPPDQFITKNITASDL